MPVQINEVIIRAVIITDDRNITGKTQVQDKRTDDEHANAKIEILELIDEVIKSKKER